MKKYLEVSKITIKEVLAYRFDIFVDALMSVFRIIIAYFLWKTIYAGKSTIGNYTFEMMMTYYILTSIFLKLNQSEDVLFQFASEIKKGYFTKYIIRPVNPIHFFMAKSITRTFVTILVNVLTMILWIIIFNNFFIAASSTNILFYVIFFALAGMLVMIQISYFVSMFAFKFVEIVGFYYMLQNIMDFLSGLMIPLFLLPDIVISVIKYLPFYYTLYFPASLYLGENHSEIGLAFIIVSVWNLLLYIVNQLLYKYSIRYYEGVGA